MRALVNLRRELEQRIPRIERATSTKVTLGPVQGQSFVLSACWQGGSFERSIAAGEFFAVCRAMRTLVSEILKGRGI